MKKKGYLIITLCLLLIAAVCGSGKSDKDIRSSVVMLHSDVGACSGEQIQAPSGQLYILSAGHCAKLADSSGFIMVKDAKGADIPRHVIMESPDYDLLLLEGIPGMPALNVASSAGLGDHVRTFTHGKRMPTYRTEGELIAETTIVFEDHEMEPGDNTSCSKPKNIMLGDGEVRFCFVQEDGVVTTALTVPGSSGGAVVNDSGDLVGIASAGDGTFGILVPLSMIKTFLLHY